MVSLSGDQVARPAWRSWNDVPDTPHPPPGGSFWVAEVFAGEGGTSDAWFAIGFHVLPPIDVVVRGAVLGSTDVKDKVVITRIRVWFCSGLVDFVHFGTPCTTYSIARRLDGGPPPLRTKDLLDGVPGLALRDQAKVDDGTLFMRITAELATLISSAGGHWSIENPASSMIWATTEFRQLASAPGVITVEIDMCMYGTPFKKPTRLLASHAAFAALARRCTGVSANHKHVELAGK